MTVKMIGRLVRLCTVYVNRPVSYVRYCNVPFKPSRSGDNGPTLNSGRRASRARTFDCSMGAEGGVFWMQQDFLFLPSFLMSVPARPVEGATSKQASSCSWPDLRSDRPASPKARKNAGRLLTDAGFQRTRAARIDTTNTKNPYKMYMPRITKSSYNSVTQSTSSAARHNRPLFCARSGPAPSGQ